jgi:hypothetical protein|tara:strand:+ start:2606 stop:3028 length:423 start_codon:yes stop_codon:yes gene_type:complete
VEVGFVNYWTKITFVVFALVVSIVAWAQINNLTKPSSAPVPVIQKLYFEGTIGGKHAMSLSIDQVGRNITGTIVNTHREIRKLKGSIGKDERFHFSEYLKGHVIGTFEGKILSNGNMRGIWFAPPGIKRYPFYLNRKARI